MFRLLLANTSNTTSTPPSNHTSIVNALDRASDRGCLLKLTSNLHSNQRNVAEEDGVAAAKDDVDGETGTESDTDSDMVVLNFRPVQHCAGRPDYSLQKPETQAAASKMSRPSKDNRVGCSASRFEPESEPDGEVPPLVRVYRDSPDMDFEADYKPGTDETPRKKHRKRYETTECSPNSDVVYENNRLKRALRWMLST